MKKAVLVEPCGGCSAEQLQVDFSFLTVAELQDLHPFLEKRVCAQGETLMREGDVGDFMGFLVSGKLAVKKETTFPGKYILVAVLERGSMVGEISVVERGRRTATVIATEESLLMILTADSLDRLVVANPALAIKLLRRVIHVLGSRLRKASDRLSLLL
ncbi:MAG: cyclic nucleotide-binding domain-containing protein [Desulfobulbaceae bacterium]|nr:cyclic nucleotide-binding domain-containing protein [Desulfobulbaceae bacterium]HIJ79624.1 cyclic nucleotide-binding domain-containing protein [Deltaproteobacteria bacterium]